MMSNETLNNITLDEVKNIELSETSVLVIKSDDLSADVLNTVRDGFNSKLDFRIPIIGMGNDSDISDIGAEGLIDTLVPMLEGNPELLNKLLLKLPK